MLYISGEESESQIKMRAERLNAKSENLFIMAENNLNIIEHNLEGFDPDLIILDSIQTVFTPDIASAPGTVSQIKMAENNLNIIEHNLEGFDPDLIILDSIQTVFTPDIASAPGTVSQIKEGTSRFMRISKKMGISTFVVGHVTKEGALAGPKIMEHMVDTVLYFEGERYNTYRLIRAVKNRFGSTNELGVFEMSEKSEKGLQELENPSKALISEKPENASGSVIVSTVEGTRPMLLELQALVSPTSFGIPRRTATGIDFNRVNLLLAVLEKRAGMQIQNQDVYLNIVGGIKINEPSMDLGVILAVASGFRNIPISGEVAVTGEVGLTGEIRGVSYIEKRISECRKLGFKKIIIPKSNYEAVKDVKGIEIWPVENVRQAINMVLRGE